MSRKGNTGAIEVFDVNALGGASLHRVSSIATGEVATCWIVRVGGALYASNAGSGMLSEVRDAPGEPLALLGTVATGSGTVGRE